MFPLSTNFVEILQIATIFSVCAVSFSIAPKRKVFFVVPIIVGSLVFYWQNDVLLAANSDQVSFGIMFIGIVLLIAASAFWAFVVMVVLPFFVRQIPRFPDWEPKYFMVLFLAISPAVAVSLPAFVLQIVPENGECVNDSISLTLGAQQFSVRYEFEARLTLSAPDKNKGLRQVYSKASGAKESLRVICDLSKNGNVAIPVDEVLIYPINIAEDLEQKCFESTEFSNEFCAKLSKSDYQRIISIRFTNNPLKYLRTMSSWFGRVDDPAVSTGGDMKNGFVCHGTDNTSEPVYCTVWFPVDPEISVVASSRNDFDLALSATTKTDVLTKIREAIDITLEEIRLEN